MPDLGNTTRLPNTDSRVCVTRDHVALAVDDVEVRRAAGVLAVIGFAHGRRALGISFAQCLCVSDESGGTGPAGGTAGVWSDFNTWAMLGPAVRPPASAMRAPR